MALKEEKVFVTSGKKKGSVRRVTKEVSGMSNDRAKPTPKAAPPSEPQSSKHEVEACREKEMPEAEASLGNSIDPRVNTS